MIFQHFKKLNNFNAVNNYFIYCCEKLYPLDKRKDNVVFNEIVKEYQFIEANEVEFPIGGNNVDEIESFIKNTFSSIKAQGRKEGQLFFLYQEHIKTNRLLFQEKDIRLVAKLLNYNEGWVYYKKKELQN